MLLIPRQFLYEITKKGEPAKTKKYTSMGVTREEITPAVPARGALGIALNDKIKIEGEFKIGFAGIFDTVPSYKGLGKLNLEAVKKAQDVLHLTAMDERRAQFALCDITTSKGASYEKELPGSHSDIGGGYNPIEKDIKGAVIFAGNKADSEKEIEYYMEEGWFWHKTQLESNIYYEGASVAAIKHIAVPPTALLDSITGKTLSRYCVSIVKPREVHHQYSYIPLHIMKDKAMAQPNNLKFNNKKFDDSFKIPEELNYGSMSNPMGKQNMKARNQAR